MSPLYSFTQVRFFVVLLLLCIVPISHPVHGATFDIPNGDIGELLKAINLANDETLHPGQDEITLAPDGVYTLTDFINNSMGNSGLPIITSAIIINGNGATIQRSEVKDTPYFRIFYVNSEGSLDLNHVTIRNGNVTGGSLSSMGSTADGGAILNLYGVVNLRDSVISGNMATNFGGGIANGGVMNISNSTITGNISEFVGGGIDNFCASDNALSISDTVISDNSAKVTGGGVSNRGTLSLNYSIVSNNSAQYGGGIANYNSGTLTVLSSTFSDNRAQFGGGIATLFPGTITVTDSTFSGNVAEAVGGGIVNEIGTTLTILSSTFITNSSQMEGGAIAAAGTSNITHSKFISNSASRAGAIGNEGEMSIVNCTFIDNKAEFIGGAIRNYVRATLIIEDSTISRNSAQDGGGISTEGNGTIRNCIFAGNSADEFGGGVFNFAEIEITDSTFDLNTAGASGGGIYNDRGHTVALTACTFSDNSAMYGGGLINYGGTAHVDDTTFSSNIATQFGGGINNAEGGTLMLSDSTLFGNSAMYGGGVTNSSEMIITNSTLSGNIGSNYGGAIINVESGTLTVSSTTICDNQAAQFGAGIDNSGIVTVKNTIVANSVTGRDCDNTPITGQFITRENNLSTDGSCPGFTQTTSQALKLGILADNGGVTKTHALLRGSIALDAVTDCTMIEGLPMNTDQRGIERPFGAACDIGAFEATR